MGLAVHIAQEAVYPMNAVRVAAEGASTIEHHYGYAESSFSDRQIQKLPPDYNYSSEPERFYETGAVWLQAELEKLHTSVIDSLLATSEKTGFTLVPTMVVYEANRDIERAKSLPWLKDFALPAIMAHWSPSPSAHGSYFYHWTSDDEADWAQMYRRWQDFVEDYKNRGGKVAVGSDVGSIYSLWGLATIREIALLEECSFSPLEALHSATEVGAISLGSHQLGAIRPGYLADLVVLTANPLEDIKVMYGTDATRQSEDGRSKVKAVNTPFAMASSSTRRPYFRTSRTWSRKPRLNHQARGTKPMHKLSRELLAAFTGLFIVLFASLAASRAQRADTEPQSRFAQDQPTAGNPFAQMHYRQIGPGGNRVAAVVGEPGNPMVIYAGASDGGIWKTGDGGTTWAPVFDRQNVSAIGALAIDPSNHNTVWAGTGETWIIRPDQSMGDGIYKSTDGGASWQHMGLGLTGHIGRILVDPHNSNVVYACAMGQAYRPQQERGIYRSADGGKSWKQVLFVDQNTGCSELSMDAHDNQTLFAGMWQIAINTWDEHSGGPGGGVYVSHDGGETWSKVSGHGLPAADKAIGKVAVQVAPSDSNRIYALIQEDTPRFYRSDDRGETWKIVNQLHVLSERSPYYTRFAVDPKDENFIFFVAVTIVYSRDGGVTLADDITVPAGDVHDVWYDPDNAERVMVAHDHGISVSLNGEKTYATYAFPIAQMYHAFTDDEIPYNVMGNRQDEPTFRGPSNNLQPGRGINAGGITAGDWTQIGGCEPGFSIPDYTNSNIIWSGCYNGDLTRMDLRTGQARWVSPWPEADYGWAPKDVRYRFHWTMPLAISPHDHNRIYAGSQYVHQTEDSGQSWKLISPDLTLNDKSHQQSSGGMHGDNLMTFEGSVLYAIAESPVKAGVIWTGSTDGQVNLTQDGGKSWTNLTKNIAGMPPLGTIWSITPSAFDAGTAYVVNNLEQGAGDYNAYVYKTADFGRTWKLITGSIPKSVNSSAHTIVEDPIRKGMLFLGTDNFIYITWDDGDHWTLLRNNMPPAPIYWLTIQKRYNDLVAATYGRGFWILDDITPLRTFDLAKATDVTLFKPRPSYRYRTLNNTKQADTYNHVVGENPPTGADLNYYLKSSAKKVTISITTEDGKPVRELTGSTEPGINRIWWDLRYEAPSTVKLRNSPPGEPWVKTTNGPDHDWRPLVHWRNYTTGPQVAPGMYIVKLNVDGKKAEDKLTILRDPKDLGTEQDIESNTNFLLQLRSELNESATTINRIEWTRKQLTDLQTILLTKPNSFPAIQLAKQLGQQIDSVERLFFPLELTGRTEDAFRVPTVLYGKLTNLAFLVDGGADLPPTDQSVALNKELQQQLAEAQQASANVYSRLIPQFNDALKSQGFAGVLLP
jgi:photosystem II stability/assembly factor-like uncharacterized protein